MHDIRFHLPRCRKLIPTRMQGPVLLAVDRQFGECAALRIARISQVVIGRRRSSFAASISSATMRSSWAAPVALGVLPMEFIAPMR